MLGKANTVRTMRTRCGSLLCTLGKFSGTPMALLAFQDKAVCILKVFISFHHLILWFLKYKFSYTLHGKISIYFSVLLYCIGFKSVFEVDSCSGT